MERVNVFHDCNGIGHKPNMLQAWRELIVTSMTELMNMMTAQDIESFVQHQISRLASYVHSLIFLLFCIF